MNSRQQSDFVLVKGADREAFWRTKRGSFISISLSDQDPEP